MLMMELCVNYSCGLTYFSQDLIQSIFRNDSFILIVTCNHTIIYDYFNGFVHFKIVLYDISTFYHYWNFRPLFLLFNLVGCRIFIVEKCVFISLFVIK